jgi:hypothetical protein
MNKFEKDNFHFGNTSVVAGTQNLMFCGSRHIPQSRAFKISSSFLLL